MTPDELKDWHKYWVLKRRDKKKIIRSEASKAYRRAKQKENISSLSDSYIRGILKPALGNNIPAEVIDIKRVMVSINRELRRLRKIIKTCSKHGKLTRADVNITGKLADGSAEFKCKKCQKELARKYYLRNADKIANKYRNTFENNPEKIREIKRKSRKRNAHKHVETNKERLKIYKQNNYTEYRHKENIRRQRSIDNLYDGYVRKLLTKGNKISLADITPAMIEAKRMQVRIARSRKKINIEDKIHSVDMNLVNLSGDRDE